MDGCAQGGMKEVALKTEIFSHLPLRRGRLKNNRREREKEGGKKEVSLGIEKKRK